MVIHTRALVAHGGRARPRVEDVTLDAPARDEVVVRVRAAAVCSTERLVVAGDGPARVLGHAGFGHVIEVGADVRRVRAGDPVVITGTRQCGVCPMCELGVPGACDDIFRGMERVVGRTANGDELRTDGGMGTHADHAVVLESNVVRVAGELDPHVLALLGCGITSGVGAVREVAAVERGQSVSIAGCGHLGLWMVQAARLAGASPIIAIDPSAHRRGLALTMGATHAIPHSDGVVVDVRSRTSGRGVDVALEAAGTARAVAEALAGARYGGVVVPTGLEAEDATVTLPMLEIALASKRVEGSQCGGGDVLRIVPAYEALLERGELDATDVITEIVPLEAAQHVHAALGDERTITIVLTMSTEQAKEQP